MALLLLLLSLGEGVPNNRVPTINPIVKIVNTIASKINIDLGVKTISDLPPLRGVPRPRPMDGPDPLAIRMIMLVEVSGLRQRIRRLARMELGRSIRNG